jgi:hypothetical protein
MKYEFGVASLTHFSGAGPEYMGKERFTDYDSAKEWATNNIYDCWPTIYVIVDGYAFHCERSAVENIPHCIQHFQSTEWGMIKTIVWWNEFIQNPEKFYHLSAGKAGTIRG